MKNPYSYFPNFVLRTPILSFGFYKDLTSQEVISHNTLRELFNNPLVQEACFLASPTLFLEMEKWIKGELDSKKEKKLVFSFLKYLTRMSTRCTPFGLFAGCALGHFGQETFLQSCEPTQNTRHTRLDMNYLVALSQDLARKENIQKQLLYYPNSSIYEAGHQLRYIEYYYVESRRQHHIVEVDNSVYLKKILQKAKNGAYLEELIKILTQTGIAESEVESFMMELLESQVLVSELEPSVSGQDFMSQIMNVLQKLNGTQMEIEWLEQINNTLGDIDKTLGNSPKKYISLSQELKKQPTAFELKYLFQTDLELSPEKSELSHSIVHSIKKGMALLNKLTPPSSDNNLAKFKEAFLERYEEREMPLAKVLDVETGIGYVQDEGTGDINPLVDDLILPPQNDPYESTTLRQNAVHKILEQKLISCNREGLQKIDLLDSDFKDLPQNWEDLPDTMSTTIELIKIGRKEKIRFSGMGGSSAANLLGRFCHGDSQLHEYTVQITQLEKKMNLDKILAEIVHLPESRVGNIIIRPAFREYEIPYLAKSNLPMNHQIPIDDLLLSVSGSRLVLRSKKLGKEIVPHLTNAHNFSFNALPIYHLLCDLQTQDLRGGLYFNFGPLENQRDFLPRVEYGDLILHEAKWRIQKNTIEHLLGQNSNANALKKEIATLKRELGLPQYVLLSEGDNELLINFDNVTSVQMLLDTVKNRSNFLLKEFLFSDDGLAKGKKGYHTNQLVVSFYNEEKVTSQK